MLWKMLGKDNLWMDLKQEWAFLVAQRLKRLPAMQETGV